MQNTGWEVVVVVVGGGLDHIIYAQNNDNSPKVVIKWNDPLRGVSVVYKSGFVFMFIEALCGNQFLMDTGSVFSGNKSYIMFVSHSDMFRGVRVSIRLSSWGVKSCGGRAETHFDDITLITKWLHKLNNNTLSHNERKWLSNVWCCI